jgi:glycosyltransferase involved in cell wall biosynthesis
MPELVEDGVSGIVVPTNDPRALGSAIVRILTEAGLRDRLSVGARARISGEFSIEQTVEAMARVLRGNK